MNAPRRTALVVLAALLGIALAAAITWGTSQLVRQRIGLASEPLTAGQHLLPPAAVKPAKTVRTTSSTRTRSHTSSTTTVTATTTTVTIAPPPAPTVTVAPVESTPPVVHSRGGGGGDSSSQRDD